MSYTVNEIKEEVTPIAKPFGVKKVSLFGSYARGNVYDNRTTADIFNAGNNLDSCLHRYMIKDAIADGNVLRF